MSSHRSSAAPAAISPMAWTLIGLTVAYLAAYLVVRSQTPPGGYHPQGIPDVAMTAAVFALAAAVTIGVDRWAAGRRWMLRAVPLLVLTAVLQAVLQGYTAWLFADTSRITEGVNALMVARALAERAALGLALAFVAVGLWVTRPPNVSVASVGRPTLVAIGVIGVIALGAEVAYGVWTAVNLRDPGMGLAGAAWAVVAASVPLALSFVAIAALAHRPLGRHLPELGIAVGSVLVVAGGAALGWSQVLVSPVDYDPGTSWLQFGIPMVVRTVGWLVMVGAVAIGWWSNRRSEPSRSSLALDGA